MFSGVMQNVDMMNDIMLSFMSLSRRTLALLKGARAKRIDLKVNVRLS